MKYILIAILAATGTASAQDFNLNSTGSTGTNVSIPAEANSSKRPYYDEDQNKVWLQFRQMESDWWTTSETDPFADDRIEVNVRKSSFGEGEFDVDFRAGHGVEMGTIRYVMSRFELEAGGTQVTAEKIFDDYRIEGRVRLDNGKYTKISLDMKKDWQSDNYAINGTGITLSVNKFGITGEVTNTIAYPKKVMAVLATLSMGIFQTNTNF